MDVVGEDWRDRDVFGDGEDEDDWQCVEVETGNKKSGNRFTNYIKRKRGGK